MSAVRTARRGAAAIGRARERDRSAGLAGAWPAAPVAAALSLVAAWVHLAYWESHWNQWWGYGVAFVAMGLGQALLAAALVRRPARAVVLAGIAGNLAIVGAYVMSRTVGVPVGTHAGVAERAGTIDLAVTALEIVVVGLLLTIGGGTVRRLIVNAMLVTGAALWVLRLTDHLP